MDIRVIRDTNNNNKITTPVGQFDLILEDLIDDVKNIVNEKDKTLKEARTGMLYNYLIGLQDGLRFARPKPEIKKV